MMITVMKSKLHHATVTHANVKYEGSITIDQDLMDLTDIVKGERVQVVDLNNGERLETYVIPGERGSGVIGLNGPAALKCRKGHTVHIISYAIVEKRELADFTEKVYLLGERNAVVKSLQG